MKSLIVTLLSCSMAAGAAADCTCIKPEPGETTHWGGNEEVVIIEKEAYSALRGAVFTGGDTPLAGALVELFTHPEYLLSAPGVPRGRPEQKRVAACRTGRSGRFCFTNIPAGRYELRSSSSDRYTGWDVSQVYVILDPARGKRAELRILMQMAN